VDVEDEPAARPEAVRKRGERRLQFGGLEVGDPVECADHGVEAAVDFEVGKRVPNQLDARSEQASGAGEHVLRCVDADDAVAALDQFGRKQTGAAGDVEDVVYAALPELVEEGGDRVVAGVDDDVVVYPCQSGPGPG
jgi:hypothetical protein